MSRGTPTATLLDDETRAILAYRARISLWILFGLGILATISDLSADVPQHDVLIGAGVVRLAALLLFIAIIGRATSDRWIVVGAASGISFIIAAGLLLGALRQQFGIALMIDCGVTVAAAAFLPWGWRMQLVPVATALLAILATLMGFGWDAIAPQPIALTVVCLAISVYFAVDHERIRRNLARYSSDIAASHAEIDRLKLELEERIATRESMLEIANDRLESFCDSIATDLRPRLASIHEHLRDLQAVQTPEPSAESSILVQRVGGAAFRMERILDALLEYVALARAPHHDGPVDLSQLAETAIGRLRALEPHRRVDVVIHERMLATGDTALLTEALQHLIDNAWKFTGQRVDARIEIGTRTDADGEQEFVVRDNGVGFDIAHIGNLFQPFTRLEAIESFPGQGMGLARVARIVGRHGGRIEADASAGKGAEFRFTLGPVSPDTRS